MVITQEEWLARQRQLDLETLPIPAAYKGKTFADVDVHKGNDDAVLQAKQWVKDAPQRYLRSSSPEAGVGLLFAGPPGTGKTLLASVVAQALVLRAKKPGLVHFSSMEGLNRHRLRKMELGRMLEGAPDGVREEWWEHDAAERKCSEARLLVLDDVGQENTTPHLAKVLNELLRDRFSRGNPTIITTNTDPYEWADRFANPSLGSFIFQACYVATVVGEDSRAPR